MRNLSLFVIGTAKSYAFTCTIDDKSDELHSITIMKDGVRVKTIGLKNLDMLEQIVNRMSDINH
jgi:hypothetical protein